MNGTIFFILGTVLVASALVVALVGLRFPNFPPNRRVLAALVVYFAALVGGTTTFAVLHAADDQHARQAEEAQATAQGSSGATTTTPAAPATTTASTASTATTATTPSAPPLKLSAPSTGVPAYNTDKLSAKAGTVAIDFTNPSPVQHDVAIAQGSKVIAQSPLVSGGSTSVSTGLKPGKYVFYCTVPGHRQAGMEGTLTVK